VTPNYDESAPLADLGDPDATEVTNENYGGLKAVCERVSTELFGPDTTIIRPTYVIGPYDRSYRFTWWVDRLARGGTVLAPGAPDDPIQLIDARDQAAFVVSLLESSVTGTFHTLSPAPPFGFGQMLEAIAAEVAPPGTRLTWVDSTFLLDQGVDGAALPLWAEGEGDAANMSRASPAAALAAGLRPRPLRQTVADIHAEERPPGTVPPGIGISAEREAELLARFESAAP
jgi:2'-hydroxyisoflavone reductase